MKTKKYHSIVLTILFLFTAGYGCYFIRFIDDSNNFALILFLFAVIFVSRYTKGYFYGISSAIIGAIGVHLAEQYPNIVFDFSKSVFSLTFLLFFIVSVLICDLRGRLDEQTKLITLFSTMIENEKTKNNLLRALSHDIRTPLTGIIGSTDTMIEQGSKITAEERDLLLKDTKKDAEWLLKMVENLLSITKMNNEAITLKKQPEAIEEIVAESVAKIKKHYEECIIHVSVPEELLMIPMDGVLIEQVLFNILENACVHTKTASEISLSVNLEENSAVFRITDNGVGIDEEAVEKLFDGISMDENNIRSFQGIGLTVCKTIIEAHGGSISAYNNDDNGATVEFILPCSEKELLNESQ